MGGNATKNFGTERLPQEDYHKIIRLISNVLKSDFNKQSKNGNGEVNFAFIPAYKEKTDFGDVDLLLTGDLKTDFVINHILNNEEYFRINGIVNSGGINSLAIQVVLEDNTLTGPFQLDLIYQNQKEIFDFSLNYFSYNDMGNLIGRVAAAYGLKFGHDGLHQRLYLNKEGEFQNVYALKTQREENQQSKDLFIKSEVLITRDFDKALKLLGYDPERFKLGFNTVNDIFEYATSTKLFQKNFFDLENRNHKSSRRDKKRIMYNEFIKYIEDKEFKDNHSYKEVIENLESKLKDIHSGFVQDKVKIAKRIKGNYIYNQRLSFDKWLPIIEQTTGVKIIKDGKKITNNKNIEVEKIYDFIAKIGMAKKDQFEKSKVENMTKKQLRREMIDFINNHFTPLIDLANEKKRNKTIKP